MTIKTLSVTRRAFTALASAAMFATLSPAASFALT